MNYQEKVKLFQIASGQPVSDTPRQLTKEEHEFRDNLLREEIRELQYAIVDNNRVEILDALCDIVYVALGTCNSTGVRHYFTDSDYEYEYIDRDEGLDELKSYSDKDLDYCISSVVSVCYGLSNLFGFKLKNFKTALDRVHESNMSKFTYDIKTAEKTQEFYKKQGIDTYLETRNKLTTIYRKEDGKVLKSVEYHPVYLDDLVTPINGKEVKP